MEDNISIRKELKKLIFGLGLIILSTVPLIFSAYLFCGVDVNPWIAGICLVISFIIMGKLIVKGFQILLS